MLAISTLYHDAEDHKYYDYPRENATKLTYRVNSGKPFPVHHKDGTYSIAYGFGEKHFTYSYTELVEAKTKYQRERERIHNRNQMIAKLKELDDNTLAEIVAKYC